MTDDHCDVLLFDLGGVIVELAGLPHWTSWTGDAQSEEQIWERWLRSPTVRSFESGRSTPEDFAASIVSEFQLPVSAAEFLEIFAAWPVGTLEGALELLMELRGRPQRVACFSNTNALHWPRYLDDMELRHHFDEHFASHELGVLKPDIEAFREVARRLDCAPERILFLDDNRLNVDGARSAGLRAERVRGAAEARACLRRLGVLA